MPSRKPSLDDVEADESRERRADEPHDARALAAGVHRLGLDRRVPVLLGDVGVERFGRRMQQVAGKARDRAVCSHVLMDGIVGPARMPAVEQAHDPIGVTFAVPQPAAEEAVAPRHRKRDGRRRRSERRTNRRAELRRDALVGIEAENPVVRRVRDREVLLRPESLPRLHDHARAAAAGDFHGIIAAARIDDDDLTGERRRREALRELSGRVARDHTEAQRKLGGHARDDRGAVGAAQVDDAHILRGFVAPWPRTRRSVHRSSGGRTEPA